jgi:hypothetical protein
VIGSLHIRVPSTADFSSKQPFLFLFFIYFILFALLRFELGPTLHQPFLCCRVFWESVSQTICWGWFWTEILLIFASWVAGITGVSHRYLAWCSPFKKCLVQLSYQPTKFGLLFFFWTTWIADWNYWWQLQNSPSEDLWDLISWSSLFGATFRVEWPVWCSNADTALR